MPTPSPQGCACRRVPERACKRNRGVSAKVCIVAVLLMAGVVPAGAQQATAERRMDELFADEWATRLRENPLLATSMGVRDYNGNLPEVAPDDIERRRRQSAALLDRLSGIDVDALPEERRMDRELFEWMLRNRIESASYYPERIPFIADSGFHSGLLRAADGVSFRKLGEYDDFLQRLRAIPGTWIRTSRTCAPALPTDSSRRGSCWRAYCLR